MAPFLHIRLLEWDSITFEYGITANLKASSLNFEVNNNDNNNERQLKVDPVLTL